MPILAHGYAQTFVQGTFVVIPLCVPSFTEKDRGAAGLMQATVSGFSLVNGENVFRVCDQPHPLMVRTMVGHCLQAKLDDAWECMRVRSLPPSPLLTAQAH